MTIMQAIHSAYHACIKQGVEPAELFLGPGDWRALQDAAKEWGVVRGNLVEGKTETYMGMTIRHLGEPGVFVGKTFATEGEE